MKRELDFKNSGVRFISNMKRWTSLGGRQTLVLLPLKEEEEELGAPLLEPELPLFLSCYESPHRDQMLGKMSYFCEIPLGTTVQKRLIGGFLVRGTGDST